jgi:hypothetical protein
MDVVSIAEAVRVAAKILSLVETASASGESGIPKTEFDAVVNARNAALAQLDASIDRAQEEGR